MMERSIAENLSSSDTQSLWEHDNASLVTNENSITPHERQRPSVGPSQPLLIEARTNGRRSYGKFEFRGPTGVPMA